MQREPHKMLSWVVWRAVSWVVDIADIVTGSIGSQICVVRWGCETDASCGSSENMTEAMSLLAWLVVQRSSLLRATTYHFGDI